MHSLQEHAKNAASREIAEKVLGTAAVEKILRAQEAATTAANPGADSGGGSGGGGSQADGSSPSGVAEMASQTAGAGALSEGSSSSSSPVEAPEWLKEAEVWAVMAMDTQQLTSVTLFGEEKSLLLFQVRV